MLLLNPTGIVVCRVPPEILPSPRWGIGRTQSHDDGSLQHLLCDAGPRVSQQHLYLGVEQSDLSSGLENGELPTLIYILHVDSSSSAHLHSSTNTTPPASLA
jgi:hypothetical protein